jgi:hypothetical protein
LVNSLADAQAVNIATKVGDRHGAGATAEAEPLGTPRQGRGKDEVRWMADFPKVHRGSNSRGTETCSRVDGKDFIDA